MAEFEGAESPAEKTHGQLKELRRIIRVMFNRWVVIFGAVVILILILCAIFAPLITPYDPIEQNLTETLQQPSNRHFLGTDEVGRDVLSRIIFGSRISLLVGIVAVAIAGSIGITLGLMAGYFKGWVNIIIMRFIDAILALPPIVLMIAIAAVLGGGLTNVLIAIGIGMMPTYCRLMCGQVLTLAESDYILAARIMGESNTRVMFGHLLPNAFPPLLVLITMNFGTAVLLEATLSFLGVGIGQPTPAWGTMVADGYKYLLSNPALALAPGIVILVVVLAFNMVGDGLRDALDPRLRGRL